MTMQFPQQNNRGLLRQYAAHSQAMLPYQAATFPPEPQFSVPDIPSSQFTLDIHEQETISIPTTAPKRPLIRIVALTLVGILTLCMLYLFWQSSATQTTPAGNTTLQHFSVAAAPTVQPARLTHSSVTPNNGNIQVYLVGAVKRPGIYFLESTARVYQVLQMAGGTLPQANLVTLNLAARLSDGEEIYVTRVGETPPIVSTSGSTPATNTTDTSSSKININTASSSDLRTGLHVSSTTAQAIITYRTQHGSFTNVDQLLQVVSQAIYKKIKDEVALA